MPLNTRSLIAGLVAVLCLGVAGARFLGGGPNTGKFNRRDLANELAAWIAKEAALGAKGKTLILAPVDEKRDPFPHQLAKRLSSQLKDAGFDPVESVALPYNVELESSGEPVTHEAFLSVVRAHPDVSVIVSLVGIPHLTVADLSAQHHPRLIVASTVVMPYLKSLPPGLLDFAIEVKQDQDDPRTDPSLGELSNYFVLFRPK